MHRRSRLAALAVVVASLAGGAAPARAQNSEVVTLLQDLVRVNTSNPPGNESAGRRAAGAHARAARVPGRDRADADDRQGAPDRPPARDRARRPQAAAARRARGRRRRRAPAVDRRPVRRRDPGRPPLRARRDGLQGRAGRVHGRGDAARAGGPAAHARPDPARRGRRGGRRLRHHAGSPRTTGPRSTRASRINEGGWIFADGARRRAADGHHDDRQELAVGDVPRRAGPRRTPRGRCATARCAGSSARSTASSTTTPRRGSRRRRARTCAPGRRTASAPTARRLRAITTTRGTPAVRRRLADQLRDGRVGRAVRRAGAQHLRADDRRRAGSGPTSSPAPPRRR